MADSNKEKSNIHRNHRQKVKQRFYSAGLKGMPSHNILEMLLFFGIPYKDTNPIAHELIDRFGSLSGVFEAKRTDLMQVKGMTENAACLITMILPLYKKYSEDIRKKRTVFADKNELIEFLRTLYLDNVNIEQVYVLCFDARDSLITYRKLGEGDLYGSLIDMRKLAAAVVETNAASVIISHNHPHGIASPSQQDIRLTRNVATLLHKLDADFKDHIIITDKNFFSMANSKNFVEIFFKFNEK